MAIFFFLAQSVFALNIVELSPGYYPNTSKGRPLALAYIYVGIPDLDPTVVANQKTLSVQQEDGTIVAVTQPIRTNAGGVPTYLGESVVLLVEGDYSLAVLDSSSVQIYYVPSTAYEQYLVAGNYFYPDYSEADQGVASVGAGSTVTDILAEVGAVENATIYFSHNSGGNTTTYTFTTNTTISANYNIIIEDGAILDGAGTLTINGPMEASLDQIFGGTITPLFGYNREIYPEWFGMPADGTDGSTELALALGSINANGGKVIFTSGTYATTGQDITTSPVHIVINEAATLQHFGEASTEGTPSYIIKLDVDGCRITGGKIDLNSTDQTGTGYQRGVWIDSDYNEINGVTISDGLNLAIFINGNKNKIVNNNISECGYYGIYLEGTATATGFSDNVIDSNYIDHTGAPTTQTSAVLIYGWDTATYGAVSKRNIVSNNQIILNTLSDEAGILATHVGVTNRLAPETVISGNTILGGNMSISCEWESDYTSITGNVCKDAKEVGIEVSSARGTTVSGNTITGDPDATAFRGVSVDDNASATNHGYVTVSGNYIYDAKYHIYVQDQTGYVTITGNTTDTNSDAVTGFNIYTLNTDNVAIVGNTCNATGSLEGIRVTNIVGGVISGNFINGDGTTAIDIYDDDTTTANLRVTGNVIVGSFTNDISISGTPAGSTIEVSENIPDTEILTGTLNINQSKKSATIDSSGGAVAATLQSGLYIGQIKTIVMTDQTTSSTVTVTLHDNVTGLPLATGISGDGEVGTFDAVDETWVLMWTGTEWTTLRTTCTFV